MREEDTTLNKGDAVRVRRELLQDGNVLKTASTDPYIVGTYMGPSQMKNRYGMVAFPLNDGRGGEFVSTFKEADIEAK